MSYAWFRIRAAETGSTIKPVRSVCVATQADPRVVAACKSEQMPHQLPAYSPSSFVAAHIEAAQTAVALRFTIDAAYCQQAFLCKNGKERLAFYRKCIRSRQPLFLRAPDKTKALLFAFGEKSFDGRRRPLADLDDGGPLLWRTLERSGIASGGW